MIFSPDICQLCSNTSTNLKTLSINDNNDGILLQTKLKYCFPEIVDQHLEVLKYLCSSCLNKLDCFYIFKQMCLRNYTNLNNQLQTSTSSNETNKHISVRLADIQQIKSNCQTLPNSVGDDEKQTKEQEDDVNCINKNGIETHSVFEEENNVTIKEECQTIDSNADVEFHPEFVKCESFSTDPNSPNLENEETTEHSNDSNNCSENIATKRYQCTVCDKKYSTLISFKCHLNLHAGVKGFSCSICNKKFTLKSNLLRHKDIHKGIKKFECSICKKKFMRNSDMIQHEKHHARIEDFECKVCKKVFTYKSNLTVHEKQYCKGVINKRK